MNKDRKLPVAERSCPKCSNTQAHGPEYRRGFDDVMGEHLRYYCTVCRYMTIEPTKDADTPERRAELLRLFEERMATPRPPANDDVGNRRNHEIDAVRRDFTRRGLGWKRD